jgi:preflagellin peptidase FlaK
MFKTLIDNIAFVACIIPLVFASYSDWKNLTVKNEIWLIMIIAGLAVATARWIYTAELFTTLLSILASFLISLLLYAIKIFGGADVKAMVCISLLISKNVSTSSLTSFFPLTVFLNTFILLGLLYIIILSYNLVRSLKGEKLFPGLESEPKWRKILALLTCTQMDLDYIQTKKHYYPAQQITKKNGKIQTHLIPPRQALSKAHKNFTLLKNEAHHLPSNRIWVYFPKPLIPIILISVIISFFIGDLPLLLNFF